jgi:trehalose/maltose hydrolase-like predicted phosphorylase
MGVWSLIYEEFDPRRQGLREALCTLGNGYFATRDALPEAEADGVNYPVTYVAGLYNRLHTDIAGRTVENEDLVNVPNWLPLSFRVAGGEWFDVRHVDLLDHHQELDMHRGLLIRSGLDGRVVNAGVRRYKDLNNRHLEAADLVVDGPEGVLALLEKAVA